LAVYLDNQINPIFTSAEYTGIATVLQAELYAIQMACEYAATRQETQVTILSDCQSAILATAKPLIFSRTVKMTVDAINSLDTLGKSIKIQWVRGHNGTTGNDKADLMAKRAPQWPLSVLNRSFHTLKFSANKRPKQSFSKMDCHMAKIHNL
jgi:ribonuclease HI